MFSRIQLAIHQPHYPLSEEVENIQFHLGFGRQVERDRRCGVKWIGNVLMKLEVPRAPRVCRGFVENRPAPRGILQTSVNRIRPRHSA